jgi:ADP-ribose pyrophosphatase
MSFERIDSRKVWEGRIATVRVDCFRYDDGGEAEREIVAHPGAVAMVVHDGETLFLVRQPREAVDESALLELPAGKLDEAGETVLECARRELAEEIGKAAETWEHLVTYKTSAGFTDEVCHIYLATGLRDKPGYAIADERIAIDARPLDDLGALVAEVTDAKTLIGLLLLRARRG